MSGRNAARKETSMKGNISLGDFISQVKTELVEAQDSSGAPFFQLEAVDLEVTFALEAAGGAKAKLVVVELGGDAKASQTHKVTIKFTPVQAALQTKASSSPPSGTKAPDGGGGGFGGGGRFMPKPVYAPKKD
jgi:Trypsin-co-occurring domain 2